VSERKPANSVEFKADDNFNRRNTLSILRIKIWGQRRNRLNWWFSVEHYLLIYSPGLTWKNPKKSKPTT